MRTLLLLILVAACPASAETARGVVFNDLDRDGAYSPDEPPLEGVAVSDGREIVVTDADGRYALPVESGATIFCVKPANYEFPLRPKRRTPLFYYHHRPQGSPALTTPGVAPTGPLPERIDFPLHWRPEPVGFDVLCFGDPQPHTHKGLDYLAQDILPEALAEEADFGVTLGDLTGDRPALFEEVAELAGLTGVPWRHVIGNHDFNHDAPSPQHADDAFERVFGPTTYAFNYGQAHFIALNNVRWESRHAYAGGLTEDQWAFLERDLDLTPGDRLIVILMHIPLPSLPEETQARFLRLLAGRPHTLSLSAHWHHMAHFHVDRPVTPYELRPDGAHHHVVLGTTCGGFFTGPRDARGIPAGNMLDGGPNGYGVLHVEGNRYRLEWRPAGQPEDARLAVWTPSPGELEAGAPREVAANFWAGSPRAELGYSLDDGATWRPMSQQPGPDPHYVAMRAREAALLELLATRAGLGDPQDNPRLAWRLLGLGSPFEDCFGRASPAPCPTTHVWRAPLPADLPPGPHLARVRATDMYGAVHEARRVVTLTPFEGPQANGGAAPSSSPAAPKAGKGKLLVFAGPALTSNREVRYLANDVIAQAAGEGARGLLVLGALLEGRHGGAVSRMLGLLKLPRYEDPEAGVPAPLAGYRIADLRAAGVDALMNAPNDGLPLLALLPDHPSRLPYRDRLLELLDERRDALTLSAGAGGNARERVTLPSGRRQVHIAVGAATGANYAGRFGEEGMPHALQPDGSPNGYGIVSHDGQWRYAWRAAGRPASYQMAVTAPQRVRPDELRAGIPVTANVFALSPDAEVRLSLDGGPARPMRPWTGAAPNYAARLSEDREMLEEVLQLGDGEADAAERTAVGDELQAIVGPFLPEPAETGHLFRANLPDSLEVGFHTLRVDALGALGERFTAYAVLRVADKPDLVFEPGDWE